MEINPDILKALEDERNQRLNKTWNKLDNGSKLNRLIHYCDVYSIENEFNDEIKETLLKFLKDGFKSHLFEKSTSVEYNMNEKKIVNIPHLNYNGKTKTFEIIKLTKSNKLAKPKTRTAVERHVSRSKDKNGKSKS